MRLPISEAFALAGSHLAAGRLAEAEAIGQAVRAAAPHEHRAAQLLGLVAVQRGQLLEAERWLRLALADSADQPQYHDNLAVVLCQLGRLDEAETAARRALALRPNYAEAYNNLGNILLGQKRPAEAEKAYRRSLDLAPSNSAAWTNLGTIALRDGRLAEAESAHRRALGLQPRNLEAAINLGSVLQAGFRFEEACQSYQQALQIHPQAAALVSDLGVAREAQGRVAEAIEHYAYARQLQPADPVIHSRLLMAHQYLPGISRTRLAELHAEWDRCHAAALYHAGSAATLGRAFSSPLRLGLLGATLGRHPVGYFLLPIVEAFDPAVVQLYAYSDREAIDDFTARFQQAAKVWRDIRGHGAACVADQVRADRIDVLIDLGGHTAGSRLLVFARKPAPLQLTWAGYVGTTGLSAIDGLVADPQEVPPGTETDYRERILRMPRVYVGYAPPPDAPPTGPLPATARGYVTFGSFNHLAKINEAVVAAWAEILRRVPKARLMLQYTGLSDPPTRRRYQALFAQHGIDIARLLLLGHGTQSEVLANYHQVDVALDPFPYSGGLTTCEALWMGVPVVTWPHETFAGRHALTFLTACGLGEMVSDSRDGYIEKAVRLAGDLPQLESLRATLRTRVAQSPLCDGKQLAAALLAGIERLRGGRE